MRNPLRSLLNLCAFGLLLLALYLNFVDLNKPEQTAALRQWTGKNDNAPQVAAAKSVLPVDKQH